MNRRSFLTDLIKAGVGSMILPSALSYARKWKIEKTGLYTADNNIDMYNKLPYYLASYQIVVWRDLQAWYKLLQKDLTPPIILPSKYVLVTS